jgi:hypothetical protein
MLMMQTKMQTEQKSESIMVHPARMGRSSSYAVSNARCPASFVKCVGRKRRSGEEGSTASETAGSYRAKVFKYLGFWGLYTAARGWRLCEKIGSDRLSPAVRKGMSSRGKTQKG